MSCPCTIQDTSPGVWGTVVGAFTGSPSSGQQDAIACNTAVQNVQAMGLDPCDPANAATLEAQYQSALGLVQTVVATTPNVNLDTALCAQYNIGCNKAPAQPFNWGIVIAAVLIGAAVLWMIYR